MGIKEEVLKEMPLKQENEGICPILSEYSGKCNENSSKGFIKTVWLNKRSFRT